MYITVILPKKHTYFHNNKRCNRQDVRWKCPADYKKYAALVSEKGVSLPDSVHCHMFRRTRATNLYQDGIAIELVSTVLGHARTDTTKSYYAKPSVEQLRDAMESVPTPVSDEAPMWEGNEDEMARLCGLR